MHKSTPLLSTHSNHNKEKRVVGEQRAGSREQGPKEEMGGLTQNHHHHQHAQHGQLAQPASIQLDQSPTQQTDRQNIFLIGLVVFCYWPSLPNKTTTNKHAHTN